MVLLQLEVVSLVGEERSACDGVLEPGHHHRHNQCDDSLVYLLLDQASNPSRPVLAQHVEVIVEVSVDHVIAGEVLRHFAVLVILPAGVGVGCHSAPGETNIVRNIYNNEI